MAGRSEEIHRGKGEREKGITYTYSSHFTGYKKERKKKEDRNNKLLLWREISVRKKRRDPQRRKK